jgi:actin-related protein
MNGTDIGGKGQYVLKVLDGVVLQMLTSKLAFCPGDVKGMLEQMLLFHKRLQLFTKHHESSTYSITSGGE